MVVLNLSSSLCFLTVDVKKVSVVRAYMGTLMTSLEMAGVSVTLIKLTSSRWTEYLGVYSRGLVM